MNLLEKIVEVRKTVAGLTKDAQADRYKYVSGSQVLAKIKDKMNELGVLCYPEIVPETVDVKVTTFERTNRYGDIKRVTEYQYSARCNMIWLDSESGETLSIRWDIQGVQEEDSAKAFGSALTYTERYFFMKFFNLPTDDLDPDRQKGEEGGPPPEKKQFDKKPPDKKPPQKGFQSVKESVAEKEKAEVPEGLIEMASSEDIADIKNLTMETATPASKVLQYIGAENFDDLTQEQADKALKELRRKKEKMAK